MAHILLPTDFSDPTLEAAVFAVDLFGADGNRFTLLHAFAPIALADQAVPVDIVGLQQGVEEALVAFERKLGLRCDLRKADLRRVALIGDLSVAVDTYATDERADIIMMASSATAHGTFFGSSTTGVMRSAHVPVLEIPVGITSQSFKRILFADDRSPVRPEALILLADIAARCQAEIIIAYVATGRPLDRLVDNTSLYQQCFARSRTRTIVVANENVEGALIDLAERERADLIAVLHRHTGFWKGMFHSSTTVKLAKHSKIPLLALEQ